MLFWEDMNIFNLNQSVNFGLLPVGRPFLFLQLENNVIDAKKVLKIRNLLLCVPKNIIDVQIVLFIMIDIF